LRQKIAEGRPPTIALPISEAAEGKACKDHGAEKQIRLKIEKAAIWGGGERRPEGDRSKNGCGGKGERSAKLKRG